MTSRSTTSGRSAQCSARARSEVRDTVEVLRLLNPRPAGAFSPGPAPSYVVPDVTLRRFDDEWLVIPNNEAVPTLRVSPRYRSMLRSGSATDDETRRYLKDKIRSAEIVHAQRGPAQGHRESHRADRSRGAADFFEDGKGDLRPLRLEDVADEIGVHLSTVSRGVTGQVHGDAVRAVRVEALLLGRLPHARRAWTSPPPP